MQVSSGLFKEKWPSMAIYCQHHKIFIKKTDTNLNFQWETLKLVHVSW